VDVAPAILLEIMKDEDWFTGQYMWSLLSNGAKGAFGATPPAYIPSVLAELGVHDGAEGSFGVAPPVPNTYG
jgi:hypothetical protein